MNMSNEQTSTHNNYQALLITVLYLHEIAQNIY